MERRRNFWITKLTNISPEKVDLAGYSLTRSVLTEFADSNRSTLLQNINYEPLREKSAFSFKMTYTISQDNKQEK